MISTKTSEEAQAEEKSQNQILSSTNGLEDSAAAPPEVGGIGSSRMTPYFKQPELPADFKFMEPYIKCNERDWK